MFIHLFLLSCLIALIFILLSSKITLNWVKKSFQLYGTAFMVTAFLIGVVYVNENKAAFARDTVKADTHIVKPTEKYISQYEIKGSVHLDAPHIKQLPELPRGCEVTSLGMLLKYSGVDVDKMELAERVKKDKTPYQTTKNGVYFGNPNNGFVGDMYSFDNPGLGVYHGPIADLAAQYVGIERVYDFTGRNFSEIINQLNQNRPVWVIINAEYNKLPETFFTTWQTEDGPIDITMKEHSVLITGYDQEYIYFNDPLNREEKAPINEFKAAWIQMGKQAITVF
ncbi:C39 family peptidase [Virgibacillus doumboii]|uniref:C39 family peptidase n=1 Tax=Virgibacillus doumboii TaxID=2697503 RepID=UPI0013DE9D73|nr:C39 family peptidase [Virgibacillus doumboii]